MREIPPLEFRLRRIAEEDLRAVAELEAGVFTDWYSAYRRTPDALPERSLKELRYATSFDPESNLVAIAADGSMIGFILARTWGRVGWFGTFGVPTQFQGLGVGKALMGRALDYLRSRADIVGLETMPESGANVGLYSKAGLAVSFPSIIIDISLIREADRLKGMKPGDVNVWGTASPSTREETLGGIREISDALLPGLDYSVEVRAMREHGLGETVLSQGPGGRVDGFAVLRMAPFRGGDTSGRGYIHILAVRPGADQEKVLLDLLRQMWTAATHSGLTRMVGGISGRRLSALDLLMRCGFRCMRTAVRMVDRDAPASLFEQASGVDLSRWAG